MALAQVQAGAGRPDEGLRTGNEAVKILRAWAGAEPHALAASLIITAILQTRDKPGQALLLLEEADQLLEGAGIREAAEHIAVLSRLAEAYLVLGRGDKARETAELAIRLSRELLANQLRALGADHPDTLVTRGELPSGDRLGLFAQRGTSLPVPA